MKRNILNVLWTYTKIDLLCYAVYLASMVFLNLIFFEDVPPGYRNFDPVYWSLHIIFFIAYHLVYTSRIDDSKLEMTNEKFCIKKTIKNFFKHEQLQIFLMILFAVLLELILLSNPAPGNLVGAALFMFIPSALAIDIPIVRTLVGFSVSMLSMIVSYVIINYKKYQYWTRSSKK